MTGPDAEWLTIEELAAATQTTVRTARYYGTLGLLPPPERRGRVAYYSAEHRARLDLIRALQDHGFTLAAIERYLSDLPLDASAEDLAVRGAMLTAWSAAPAEPVSRRQLEKQAGRRLTDDDLGRLLATGALARAGERFLPLPWFDVGVELLDVDLPLDGLIEAGRAIETHMAALADELTEVLRQRVLAPFRAGEHTSEDAQRFERTMSRLRVLTLEAILRSFQHSADAVITRTLAR